MMGSGTRCKRRRGRKEGIRGNRAICMSPRNTRVRKKRSGKQEGKITPELQFPDETNTKGRKDLLKGEGASCTISPTVRVRSVGKEKPHSNKDELRSKFHRISSGAIVGLA